MRVPNTFPVIMRILIVGTATAKTDELIGALVGDLSGMRWAALEHDESSSPSPAEIGRVRLSAQLALHVIAMRGEQRFWPVWEEYLPESIGTIFVLPSLSEWEQTSLRSFLIARDIIAPAMPIVVSAPARLAGSAADEADLDITHETGAQLIVGSLTEQWIRLDLLSHLLERWLIRHAE
jgi:signal recognition particle receptor subunit beta